MRDVLQILLDYYDKNPARWIQDADSRVIWEPHITKPTTGYCLFGGVDQFSEEREELTEAVNRLAKAIRRIFPVNSTLPCSIIMCFNDAPGRKFEDVRRALELAIKERSK